jgi:hypothetical protein
MQNRDDLMKNINNELDVDQQVELGDLSDVEAALMDWQVPEPTESERIRMTARLRAETRSGYAAGNGWKPWFHLFRAQARLFESEFYYACGGLLLALLVGGLWFGVQMLSFFTLVISPLVAMAGVLYVFHHESEGLAQLEAVSPVGPLGLFLCRSTLILGTNLLFFSLVFLTVDLMWPGFSYLRIVAIWLGVLVGLFGLAVYTSVRWNGLLSIALPLGVWGVLLGVSWQKAMSYTGGWDKGVVWLLNNANGQGIMWVSCIMGLLGVIFFVQAAKVATRGSGQWA